MDVEFDMQYKNLLVHHLDKGEIEYELAIRGIEFQELETRAALSRRLREQLKTERVQGNADIDFNRLEIDTNTEILEIDAKVKEIKDFLAKKKSYEGTKESLKTRLVHYFARTKRISEIAEDDDDLSDVDAICSCIRGIYNQNFSLFSQSGQQEIIHQINQTLSNLAIKSTPDPAKDSSSSSSTDDNKAFVTPGRKMKRNLQSVDKNPIPLQNNLIPWFMQAGAYPWMFGKPQTNQGAQKRLKFGGKGKERNKDDQSENSDYRSNKNKTREKISRPIKQKKKHRVIVFQVQGVQPEQNRAGHQTNRT
ncbi:uncharacterized protein LOC131440655 [Malaya genurostris]|uniref:uncharacterized protein LOC131440655 n=1 Tax=Malaya genurostris TaxID=325434 RepID=UPI0026F3CD36|nr:uncharacterized protein LOC131440655 [Malaya genurostris]XP_058468112.1 uncharacterized protein LOC131440655 [Malaya genurostris]